MKVLGLDWVGTWTDRFDETVSFFETTLGLPIGKKENEFVRLDLPNASCVEVFGPGDADHRYFTTGPAVGFLVEDFDAARRELVRHRLELLGPAGGSVGEVRWQHLRAPDGYVYEIVDHPGRHALHPPSGPIGITHLAWVGTRTAHYDATRAFFRDVLGLPVVEDLPELTEYRLPDGAAVEVFLPGSPLDHPHFSTGPVPGFGVEDFERAVDALRSRGVRILQSRQTAVGGWAHFRALDGWVYELKGGT
jgi:catechol 2,3-dioxygenase-like lactoylglutathione lyase family enzyme